MTKASSEPTQTEDAEAPAAGAPQPTATPQDDIKRRFREALERKNARAKSGESHADGSSKVHLAHGPNAHRRTFRRKSG